MAISNLKSLAHSTFVYSFGNIALKVVGLILLPLYTHYLSLEDFGILSVLEVSVQLMLAVFSFGLHIALFRWFWEKKDIGYQQALYYTTIIVIAVISGALLIGVLPFKEELTTLLFSDANLEYVFVLMLLSVVLQNIGLLPSTLLRLHEKPLQYTYANILKLAVTLILTIILMVYFDRYIEGIFEAQVIGHLVYLLVLTPFSIKHSKPVFLFAEIKAMFGFSLPLVFAAVSAVLLTITDRYALNIITGPTDTGIYSMGYKIANTLNIFIATSVNLAIQPMIFKMAGTSEGKAFQVSVLKYLSLLMMVSIIAMSAFGLEILEIVSQKPEYVIAYKIIPVIAFSILFAMIKDIVVLGMHIKKRTKILGTIIIVMAFLNLGLNILFIPLWNALGAAYATLITQIVYLFVVYYYSQKIYYLQYELKNLFLLAVVGGGFVILSQMFNEYNIFVRVIVKSGLVIAFPVALYLFKFYTISEMNLLLNIWNKWKNPTRLSSNIKEVFSKK